MKKQVIILNGGGGVGKDTLIEFAAKTYKIINVSSIDPIKEIASAGGWQGEKDEKGRKLLIAIKAAFVAYNDLPFRHCIDEYLKFLESDNQFMFVHIREPQEIEKFRAVTGAKTILITRKDQKVWGNAIDDECAKCKYDLHFDNSDVLEVSGARFVKLLDKFLH